MSIQSEILVYKLYFKDAVEYKMQGNLLLQYNFKYKTIILLSKVYLPIIYTYRSLTSSYQFVIVNLQYIRSYNFN